MGLITPTLPAVGGLRGSEELDVLNALTTILTAVNGNVDGANIAASAFSAYETIFHQTGRLDVADGTFLKMFDQAGTSVGAGAGTTARVPGLIVPSSNPWALTGKTSKLRLLARATNNGVGVSAGFVNVSLAVELYGITLSGTGGQISYSVTSSVASVILSLGPIGHIAISGASTDFDVPAAGIYMFVASLGQPLQTGCALALDMRVEIRWV